MEAPHARDASDWSGPRPVGEWRPGTRVGGRYVIEEMIGEGASAITYRARDDVLGRTVALKVLRSRLARDAEIVARFEREARIAAAIVHPNVVAVYDYGRDGPAFYIVLQFVPGEDLRTVVERRGRLPAEEALAITGDILAGLGAIHLAGIVHRDVKPSNVLIGRDGIVRLTDFGVAYEVVADRLTSHGTTIGTAAYMAPEQARGGELSPATDLYAVGVVLFELLTGRLPFAHDNPMATLLAQIQTPAPRPSDLAPDAGISPAVEAVVLRVLAKQPTRRFASAPAMAAALVEASGGVDRSLETTRLTVPGRSAEEPDPLISSTAGGAAATVTLGVPATTGRFAPEPPDRAVSLPPPRRRVRPWPGPLAVAAVALVALAAVVLTTLGRDGGGDDPGFRGGAGGPTSTERSDGPGVGVSAATATVTTEATSPAVGSTAIPLNTPTATATEPPPTASPTVAPTEMPPPSPTPTAAPTETPQPTATPSPTAVVVDDAPVVASDGTGGTVGSSIPQGLAPVQLSAGAWEGGEFREQEFGQPATLLTGRGNGREAEMTFVLAAPPSGGVVLGISGYQTAQVADARVEIEFNGVRVWEGESPFGIGGGEAWVDVEIELLPEDFVAGENSLTIRFRAPDGRSGRDAVLALGDVTVAPAGTGNAAAVGSAGEGSDEVLPVVEEESGTGSGGSLPGSSGGDQPQGAPTIAPQT